QALNIKIQNLTTKEIYDISTNAKSSTLPFKHHARDFIIGTQALLTQNILITYNIKHFTWMGKDHYLTPDELVLKISK
ncbi:hypothetical protein LCGC14_2976610, partial [marine sediment metagenome]